MSATTDLIRRGYAQWRELNTSWTRIRRGKGGGGDARAERGALAELYMPLVFWLARRMERLRSNVADSAQEALLRMLGGWVIEEADEARGRFRSFLSICIRRMIGRRGQEEGRLDTVPLSDDDACAEGASDDLVADDETLARIRAEAREAALRRLARRPDAVKALMFWLLDPEARRGPSLEEVAARLGMGVRRFRYATEVARRVYASEVRRLCAAEEARGEGPGRRPTSE